MNNMKKILCPYCCETFTSLQVEFRLERPLQEVENGSTQESIPGMGLPFNKTAPVKKSTYGVNLDKKLYDYYKNYLNWTDADAESEARKYGTVRFDLMNPRIHYNSNALKEHGYVTTIEYEGQKLEQRLCPHCHNKLVPEAGKYDIVPISVIGDTNVGKSIYILVLCETLKKQPGVSLLLMGGEEDKEAYEHKMKTLLHEKQVISATNRVKVPPMVFKYSYNMTNVDGSTTRTHKLLVFYDIAGEDCRNAKSLKTNGYHIRASEGILFLVDPTRFHNIQYNIGCKNEIDNSYQLEIFAAINEYLLAHSYSDTVKTPTAFVLAKSDRLKTLPFFQEEPKNALVNGLGEDEVHKGFVDVNTIHSNSLMVEEFLHSIGEDQFCSHRMLFRNSNFFISSSLGNEVGTSASTSIQPFGVLEPFYWIMGQNGHMVNRHFEKETDDKQVPHDVVLYYCADESQESLQNRIDLEKQLIHETYDEKEQSIGGKFMKLLFGNKN